MGKKYIVELKKNETLYKAATRESDGTAYVCSAIGTPYTAPDLEQIRKEAWEAARTLWNTPKRKEIFGYTSFNTALMTLTAQEVIEKIRAYEQAQEKIQVGDEVDWMGDKYVVTYVRCEEKKADLISCKFGSACENVAFSSLQKTGRHFPDIAEVLQKMKETDNG